MSKSGLAGSAAAMASGTLVSRVLGLVRNVLLLAAISSVGGAANAFSVANKLPNIIYLLIAGGVLNAILVPQIVRAMRSGTGETYVNRLLTLGGSVLFGITALLTAGATVLLTIYAGSIDPEWRPIALAFAYLCMPQLFFYGLYTLLGQVLNARGNFGPYMWAPVLNNVVAIAGLVAYLAIYGRYSAGVGHVPEDWSPDRVLLFAGSATAGVAAQALILVVPLWRSGFRYRPDFRFRGSGLGRTSRVAMWAFAALGVGQIGYVAISNLAMAAGATEVPPGSPSLPGNGSYDTAFMIFMLPQSLITVSLVTAIFTRLSHHAAAGAAAKVRDDLSFGLRTLGVFTVFGTGALMVLAIPTVTAITVGQISWDEQRWIGHIVAAFAAGLVGIGAWTMIQRIYYAYEDTRALFYIQVPMMLIIVAGCGVSLWLLEPQWWVVGTAVATTISNSFGALVAYLALRRRLPSLDGARVLRTHLRLVLAVVPAVAAGWGLLTLWGPRASFAGAVLRVVVIGLLMLGVYLAGVHRLQVSELHALMARIGKMLDPLTRRLGPVFTRLPGAGMLRTMGLGPVGARTPQSDQGAQTAVTLPPPSPGDMIADRYRLIEAETGSVLPAWLAEDEILARNVRIVFLPADHREEALNAARRSALVSDPRLPRVHRVGTSPIGDDDAARAFVITEHVDGSRLDQLLSEQALSEAQARAVIGEAAAALSTARRRGVHHLALGPASIAVTTTGEVRVLGLGFARAGLGIEAHDSAANSRADAVALVQLLYAALTGTWPGPSDRAGSLPLAADSGGVPTPLGDLVDVSVELDTLCAVTFSPHGDGPYTAGDVVKELAPWSEVAPAPAVLPRAESGTTANGRYGGAGGGPAGAPESASAAAAAGTAVIAEDPQTGEYAAVPTGAPRWSPRLESEPGDAYDQPFDQLVSVDEAEAPGNQPARHAGPKTHVLPASSAPRVESVPAIPVDETGGWDLPAGHASAATTPPRPRSAPTPRAPVEQEEGVSTLGPAPTPRFGPVSERRPPATQGSPAPVDTPPSQPSEPAPGDEAKPWRRSSVVILLVMLAVLVFGVVLAINALRDPFAGRAEPEPTDPWPLSTSDEEPSESDSAPAALPTTTPSPTSTEPMEITDGISFDPTASGGENQDLAYYAYDGDPDTFWRSLRYNSPTYGMKEGLGFTVELNQRAEVSEVVLNVMGSGGHVQIRAAGADAPNEGPVLAEGPLDHETTFTFDKPAETDSIALWFTELPVADSDGRNRIELAEVEVR